MLSMNEVSIPRWFDYYKNKRKIIFSSNYEVSIPRWFDYYAYLESCMIPSTELSQFHDGSIIIPRSCGGYFKRILSQFHDGSIIIRFPVHHNRFM